MAQVTRYTNKDPITNGTTSDKLNLEDKLPLQHTKGDNADKYASLLAITATPYGTTGTGASTATKNVTLSNYPADFTAIVGTKVRVKFTNANTAATQMYLKIGSLAAKPATCRGFPMTAGSVLAGSEIEFMYNGTSWDCQLCEAISTANTSSKSPVNSTALNGALANLKEIAIGNETDANNCIPDTNTTQKWRIIGNGESYNLPIATYVHAIIEATMYRNAGATYFCLQQCYCYVSGQKTLQYTRIASSSNKTTWTWGEWEQVETESSLNGALVNYQPIVSKKLSGGEEWDTGIFLNKALSNYIDYHYKKSHLLLISTINGYGDTVSSRLIMLSIGRSANSITTTTIAEKSSTGSISILNYAQFVPSQETTEVNDNNTLVIKNSSTNSNYSFEIRFI